MEEGKKEIGKRLLTVQVFLFGAHDFVSGGLADCFGHGGSRYTVLGSGDPVRDTLPRHLQLRGESTASPGLLFRLTPRGKEEEKKKKKVGTEPPLAP